MSTTADFQISIAVASSPAEAFDYICRVTDWWTTDIDGQTRDAGTEFTVSFADTYVDFEIVEFVPGEIVSWKVANCYLPWLEDKTEWTGTTVRFEVFPTAEGSKLTLTHIGLREELECFEGCREGWTHHFSESLQNLISKGKGLPMGRTIHARATIASTASEVFEAICRVPEWWSAEFEGSSRSVGDAFKVRFGDRHMSECKVVEIALGQRIVWEVIDSNLAWLDNKTEWTDTKIIWVIQEQQGSAKVTMTHKGLNPESECFTNCERGWRYFVSQSLPRLITEGKGLPGIPATAGDTNE